MTGKMENITQAFKKFILHNCKTCNVAWNWMLEVKKTIRELCYHRDENVMNDDNDWWVATQDKIGLQI